jgi:hypothetical protein
MEMPKKTTGLAKQSRRGPLYTITRTGQNAGLVTASSIGTGAGQVATTEAPNAFAELDADSASIGGSAMGQVHFEASRKQSALALFAQADSAAPAFFEIRINHAVFLARWATLPEEARIKLAEARELARLHGVVRQTTLPTSCGCIYFGMLRRPSRKPLRLCARANRHPTSDREQSQAF